MRTKIMLILTLLVFAVLNYAIYQKQQIIKHGDVMLLELAPVDPRSLIQGDYMRLAYGIARTTRDQVENLPDRGYLVVKPDEKNVAQFVRLHAGEALVEGEVLIRFHHYGFTRIIPDSFLFQEGHASYYEAAKYGVFKVDGKGNHLLTGLADKEGNTIVVPP